VYEDDTRQNVVLIDWGFAAKLGEPLQLDCGSLHYAAPEILSGARYNGDDVDAFSLGVCLFALATRCFPFSGETTRARLVDILTRTELPSIAAHLSPTFQHLICSLLDFEPTTRMSARGALLHPWFDALDRRFRVPLPRDNQAPPTKGGDVARRAKSHIPKVPAAASSSDAALPKPSRAAVSRARAARQRRATDEAPSFATSSSDDDDVDEGYQCNDAAAKKSSGGGKSNRSRFSKKSNAPSKGKARTRRRAQSVLSRSEIVESPQRRSSRRPRRASPISSSLVDTSPSPPLTATTTSSGSEDDERPKSSSSPSKSLFSRSSSKASLSLKGLLFPKHRRTPSSAATPST
jgi:serine/threonine protein kinase